ncbi:hypothetical protein CYMTET_5248 [Cymbomonas tetramitiformis]|uniref:Uncharacterized protein n=1 Tax=Cymbomonas tetramitiformis TaxID=36881 RepID=A0AAE0GZT5_9CHLO|nr:hypothetical protein CYMTET_5248 [Cymbomonas tetramitiformis]
MEVEAAKERMQTTSLIDGGLATIGDTYPPEEDTSVAAKQKPEETDELLNALMEAKSCSFCSVVSTV